MAPIPLPLSPLIAAAEAAAHGNGTGSLPFAALICLAALAFLGTLVFSRLAIQLRLPAVLGVLLLGLLLHHNQRVLSLEEVENLHVVSLSMLLFCAGLNAELQHLRGFLRYGVLLAVGGVLLTVVLFGGMLWGIYAALASFWPGLGIGALPVMALASAGWLQPRAGGDPFALLLAVQSFLKSIGSGVMVGLILTFVAQFILRRFLSSSSQILLLGIAVALSSYGLAELLHGSGFISAYVTGLFLANDIYANRWITPERLEHSLEPFNTLTEFSVFLLFGSLIAPATIVDALLPGLLSALALILIARPLSILVLQRFSPLNPREGVLLAWCGLRGAVPLALAYSAIHSLPTLPGLGEARAATLEHQLQGLLFLVVVGNLCLQGLTLPPLCRRLGLAVAD
jgi:cell volume regulation protein A